MPYCTSYCCEIIFFLIKIKPTSCQISPNNISQPIKYSISVQINYLHHTSALHRCCEMSELMAFCPTQTISNHSAAIKIIIHPHVFVEARLTSLSFFSFFLLNHNWTARFRLATRCPLSTLLKCIKWPQIISSCWGLWSCSTQVLFTLQIIGPIIKNFKWYLNLLQNNPAREKIVDWQPHIAASWR